MGNIEYLIEIKARKVLYSFLAFLFLLCYNDYAINGNLTDYSSLRGSNATAAIQTMPLFSSVLLWIASAINSSQ